MKSLAVLCSGGDAPGMNAAIRAVVRTALGKGMDVFGIEKGFKGLLSGSFISLKASDVGNILHTGGTVLGTSRCPEFFEKEVRKEAANLLKRKKISSLVVIGGNGSYNGAYQLFQEHKIAVGCLPGTIDNDIENTDYTIGHNTAIQTAIEAVDKIRDTASSHDRIFLVEVMGRSSPSLAFKVGICCGAENVILPVKNIDYKKIVHDLERGKNRGKNSSILIVAEDTKPGFAHIIQKKLAKDFGLDSRVCILGHIQRGGAPAPEDRFYASLMGHQCVLELIQGRAGFAMAVQQGSVIALDLKKSLGLKQYNSSFLQNVLRDLAI